MMVASIPAQHIAADEEGASPVSVPMWQARREPRPMSVTLLLLWQQLQQASPVPVRADAGGASPVPEQMWQG